MVVRLVKDDDPENCITLAIGDGANDVSMIRGTLQHLILWSQGYLS